MLYVNVIRKNYNGYLYIWGGGGLLYSNIVCNYKNIY